MAYLTLLEAAKQGNGSEKEKAIVEIYTDSSSVARVLPQRGIKGNSLKYNRGEAYPGVGYRGINEAYSSTVGIINPQVEALTILGGQVDVDDFLIATEGPEVRGLQQAMLAQSLALKWTDSFFNGDNDADAREMSGLKVRVTGDQLIKAGTTAHGDALSMAILDQAIDQTLNPNVIFMNKTLARLLAQAARTTTVGGYITYDKEDMGFRVLRYNGIPIETVDLNNAGSAILPFTEAAESGNSVCTSIYVCSMGPQGLIGLQNGGLRVSDIELEGQPMKRTRIEWFTGLAIFNGRAVTRVKHIKDAPFVA